MTGQIAGRFQRLQQERLELGSGDWPDRLMKGPRCRTSASRFSRASRVDRTAAINERHQVVTLRRRQKAAGRCDPSGSEAAAGLTVRGPAADHRQRPDLSVERNGCR
jgi:hypothetical protein